MNTPYPELYPPSPSQVEALLAFLPVLQAPSFVAGEWVVAPGTFPYFKFSPEVEQFLKAAGDHGWIVPFDWQTWEEGRQLIEHPERLAKADLLTLRKLIITHVRADRFSEGHLAYMFETGHMRQILERLAQLHPPKVIHFYRVNDPYGCFSNFSPHPILLKGKHWPTSEHYFQAQKFPGTEYEERIRHAHGPAAAAELGRSRQQPLRPDWEQVKDDVMREAVRTKFTQHKDLGEILLSTGEAILVEHTTNDSYWADGGDGRGVNRLGQILMELRSELRSELRQANQQKQDTPPD